jgi:hypothetical protein
MVVDSQNCQGSQNTEFRVETGLADFDTSKKGITASSRWHDRKTYMDHLIRSEKHNFEGLI